MAKDRTVTIKLQIPKTYRTREEFRNFLAEELERGNYIIKEVN